ncbi:hypothetical protein HYV30_03360 [Candidatus Kaiserbacteria bacterium]|nr:hypothetical protein [Candidatus Kaiserbacteria bacterium]
MIQGHLRTATIIIAICILIIFGLSVPRARDVPTHAPLNSFVTEIPSAVSIRDTYKKGVHSITGSLEAPNACSSATVVATSTDAEINLSIAVESDPGICLQVPTKVTFSTQIDAPPALPISVTVNGSPATTSSL